MAEQNEPPASDDSGNDGDNLAGGRTQAEQQPAEATGSSPEEQATNENSNKMTDLGPDDELLDATQIENLLQSETPATSEAELDSLSAEDLLQQAESDLARAVAPEMGDEFFGGRGEPAAGQMPFQFEEFESSDSSEQPVMPLDALQDVELDLRIEVGRARLLIDEVVRLKAGSVVPLDKLAGDPVDILVNGRLVARGEVLVLNDNFCVRVAEILTPDS